MGLEQGKVAREAAGRWSPWEGRRPVLLCAALLTLMAVNLLTVTARKSITNDEVVHIPAAYAYLVQGDFRLNNEHPPLAKLWSALPLLALDVEEPAIGSGPNAGKLTLYHGRAFWAANEARFTLIAFWARVPMIVLTLALGALLFAYARQLFGARAAVLAVALFSLEPTVLAHGRVVHTDIPAALAYLAFFIALPAYARVPTSRRAALLGLVTGAALVTKFSLLVLGPLLTLAWLALLWHAPRRGVRRGLVAAHGLLLALLVLVTINATYGFRHQPLDATDRAWVLQETPARASALFVRAEAAPPARLLPPYYLLGAYTVAMHNTEGHPAALLGMRSLHGWWYYFPVAFALKTALPFLLITLGALGWAAWRLLARRDGRFIILLAPAALYLLVAMSSGINIGIRHVLPVFPFLFILGGAALDQLLEFSGPPVARALAQATVVVLLGWLGVEAARAYPNYLPYLNELASSQPPWYYLSDSNVEWGDDVGDLARYLRARGETEVRAALSAGWDSLQHYGITYIDAVAPPGAPLSPTRYIAIGTSALNGSTISGAGLDFDRPPAEQRWDTFAAYRARVPEAVFGRSIYLYRVRDVAPHAGAALPASAFSEAVTVYHPPTTLRPGETATLRVRVRNTSDTPWPRLGQPNGPYQVRLGNRWRDAEGHEVVVDDGRAALPYDLYPGDEAELLLTVTAPAHTGDYTLIVDLVQEGVAWFGNHGATPAHLAVRVR